MTKKTVETVNQFDFEVLEHPAYHPDLALSDCCLFGPLKNALGRGRFYADKAIYETVHKWLQDQPRTFFSDRIHKLGDGWNNCIK